MKSENEGKRSHVVTIIAVAVILTFCIVFALVINLNTRSARKEQLAKDEARLEHREQQLEQEIAKVKIREEKAEESLKAAARQKVKYEKSHRETIAVRDESRLLIKKYELINKQLIDSLVTNEMLEEEKEKQIARAHKMRDSVVNLYNDTLQAQKNAQKQIAISQRANEAAVSRMRLANQRKKEADTALARSRSYSRNYSRNPSLYHGSLSGFSDRYSNGYSYPRYRVYRSSSPRYYYRSGSSYYQRGVYPSYYR